MRTVLVALLFTCGVAQAADCERSKPQLLNLVYPSKSSLIQPVQVQFALQKDILLVHFEVTAKTLNVNPDMTEKQYPFQWDVVELFLSVSGKNNLPYYEFEVSPLNQTFEVLVHSTSLPFENGIDMGIQTSTERTSTGWTANLEIPLSHLQWSGNVEDIIGNAFAIQGKKPNKSYWSLYLPQLAKPQFHQPQYFQRLLSCK